MATIGKRAYLLVPVLLWIGWNLFADEPEPSLSPSTGNAVLQGRVELPPVHPRNLYPRRMRGAISGHMSMNIPAGLMPADDRAFVYDVMNPADLRLDRLLAVEAIPAPRGGLTPPPRDQSDIIGIPGTIDASGNFEIVVPPSRTGYYIAVSGDKVLLKYRVDEHVKSKQILQNILVGVRSTLIANFAAAIDAGTRSPSNSEIEELLGGELDQRVQEMSAALADRVSVHDWYRPFTTAVPPGAAPTDFDDDALTPRHGTLINTFSACTGSSAPTTCYTSADRPFYNLIDPAEIASAGRTHVSFGLNPGAVLTNQYLSSGVRFSSVGTGPGGVVREDLAGHVIVIPPAGGGGVQLYFPAGVRAVGLTIQNGDTHTDTTGGFPRRPFRFVVRDIGGSVLHRYNWYTHQGTGAPGFYGITSRQPIYSLLILTGDSDPFTFDDPYFSSSYQTALTADLGWRSSGNWFKRMDLPEDTSFDHPYFQGVDEYADGSLHVPGSTTMHALVRGQDIHSEGNYWQCPYGVTADPEGSKLTSPAFTFNNLDLDCDDASSTAHWLAGNHAFTGLVTMGTASTSLGPVPYQAEENANCRIPAGCSRSPWSSWNYASSTACSACGTASCGSCPSSCIAAATMATHWSHVHWQAGLDIDPSAVTANVTSSSSSTPTERYVEYSTDNGASWRNAYWWEDTSHHGVNGIWWNNHMHPWQDSDMNGIDFNGNGVVDTDFDKDGTADYAAPADNNNDGTIDSLDDREWDTEFYMEYVNPSLWTDVDGDGWLDSEIEGVTILYRFRFYGPSIPSAGCFGPGCEGWKIDDVAFSNDNPRVGYFTSFDGSYDYNQ